MQCREGDSREWWDRIERGSAKDPKVVRRERVKMMMEKRVNADRATRLTVTRSIIGHNHMEGNEKMSA